MNKRAGKHFRTDSVVGHTPEILVLNLILLFVSEKLFQKYLFQPILTELSRVGTLISTFSPERTLT